MRLTTKGRFAVTAMIDLGLRQTTVPGYALAAISQRQQISLSYLEQLFGVAPPRAGGVDPARVAAPWRRKASDITVADIIVQWTSPLMPRIAVARKTATAKARVA